MSLLQPGELHCLSLYDDDILVGFIMFGYGTVGDEDEPMIAASNY